MYEIEITETALNTIKNFDREVQRRFDKRIEKLKVAPDVYGKPLRGPLAGRWEIRFEIKYRILYKIDFEKKIVTITAVMHKDEM